MSLAIGWGTDNAENSGMVFFDAVTSYVRNNKGEVTKHPISLGSQITDHFIKTNQTITISAVISGADISNSFAIEGDSRSKPFNTHLQVGAVSVNSTDQSVLQKFIPDSFGQFLANGSPDITMDPIGDDLLEPVRGMLEELNSGVIYNEKTKQFDPNIQLVKLFEYDGNLLRKSVNNLVVTSLVFKEDPNSGYALYFDIGLEQVTFAFLKKTDIPKDITSSLKKKAAKKDTKGKVDSTPDAGVAPKDIDPLRQARNN